MFHASCFVHLVLCFTLLAACSATPTRRAFKEGWRDSNITSKVKWRLTRDKAVKARDLNVDTWRGVVTLSGRVTSEEEKAQAQQIASNVKNVKEIRNYIDVVGIESVPQKVVKENVPFQKPAGKYEKPQEIALPTVKSAGETATESAAKSSPPAVEEKELAVAPATDDVTSQAEQELKELKEKKVK